VDKHLLYAPRGKGPIKKTQGVEKNRDWEGKGSHRLLTHKVGGAELKDVKEFSQIDKFKEVFT